MIRFSGTWKWLHLIFITNNLSPYLSSTIFQHSRFRYPKEDTIKYIQLNSFTGRIIRYVWTLILVFCLVFTPQPGLVSSASFSASTSSTASASEIPTWALVVATEIIPDENAIPYKYDELFMVNTLTNEIKGPFLRDELTSIGKQSGKPTGGESFDIVISPDGETA